MNKVVIFALVAFVLFLGIAGMCSRKTVEPKVNQIEYGKQLTEVIQKGELKKAELETQLADLDSSLAGGNFIYVIHVRAIKVNVNVKTIESSGDAVDFTMPTSREFWNIVKPGDILKAGVDYKGFTFTQNIQGYSVTIINKDKFTYNGQYSPID